MDITVLDDGQIFAYIPGNSGVVNPVPNGHVFVLLKGNVDAVNGLLSGSVAEYVFENYTGINGGPPPLTKFSGTYSTGQIDSLIFSSTDGSRVSNDYRLTPVDGTEKTYTLDELEGEYDVNSYLMGARGGGIRKINISASGQLSGDSFYLSNQPPDCSLRGSVALRPNGGSAFNVTLTYDGRNCSTSGEVNQGVIAMSTYNGKRQIHLYAAGANGNTAVYMEGKEK